ncbi:uncharacterized protein LOC123971550 [Micropterus dolomieu]|uniref:uncharacterized protein LOC123971550 n=1 Tax=Micropterus dolomieu TaxID=147949 RepID=UPI001E8DA990|nr:uncharacterized protein LOC123971550 [Micropterus dolomieu]
MMQFSLDKKDLYTSNCPTPGDAVSIDKCEFTVAGRENQLYWCEDTKSRSNTVNITASNGTIILKSPAFPVFAGNKVVLYCQYRIGNHSNATFFKNGREIIAETFFSSSDGVIEMTIENVTLEDEGLYKCASQDRKMESPESWLSVRPARGNFTSTDGTAASTMGSWKWIILFCGIVLLFLILLSVWLICHYRYQRFCTSSCLALPIENLPAVELPATKQDVTEVQWDLSWMEMSSLLDKQLYPGT